MGIFTGGSQVSNTSVFSWYQATGTVNNGIQGTWVVTVSTPTVYTINVWGGGTVSAANDGAAVANYIQLNPAFALTAINGFTTTGDVSIGGTASVNGNLGVTGSASIAGNLSVTGNITSTPAGFRATTPVTNVTVNNGSSATMLFGTEEVDTKNWYDPATGRFTPNVTGYYNVDWFIVTSANGTGELLATLNKNGTDIAWGTNVVNATAHWNGVGGSASMVYLNGTTDYLIVKLTNNSGSTATVYSGTLSYFSAYLIR
jgi:hypothetical protein